MMANGAVDLRRLDGKVAVVTGAAGGIGSAISEELASLGATLVLMDRDASMLAATSEKVRQQGGREQLALGCDLTSDEGIAEAARAVEKRFGRVDILVANAGILRPAASIEDITVADWDLTMAVNLRAPFLCVREFGQSMLAAGSGSIILIGSIAADLPNTTAAYGPSKAGLLALSRQIAVEWGPRGIRANSVSPGLVRTPLSEHFYADPVVSAQRMGTIPLRRPALPPDIARVVAFVASDAAAYLTGQDIVVDGAMTISSLNSSGRSQTKAAT